MPVPLDLFSPFKYFNIAPQTDWQRFINPQFNVTVNQGDAAIENHVLAAAGSYGKQIGRMQEVLDILLAQVPADGLTAIQGRAIEKYRETRADVVAAVQAVKPSDETTVNKEEVENWLDRLAKVRDHDPEQYDRLAARIGEFLSPADHRPTSQARKGPQVSRAGSQVRR